MFVTLNISKLENDDMDIHIQVELMERRGEFCLAEMLRAIIVDEITLAKEKARKKKLADNLMFEDRDY